LALAWLSPTPTMAISEMPGDACGDLSVYGYLRLACYLPATAWTGIMYINRPLHLGTIDQAIQHLLDHQILIASPSLRLVYVT
jgi:hypothetical protein